MNSKNYNPEIHHRRSIRLKYYDYNQAGAYFITICVQDKKCLLGKIKEGLNQINQYGKIVEEIWNYLPIHFPKIEIDGAVIMPNHFHGIIVINEYQKFGESFKGGRKKDLERAGKFYDKKTFLGSVIAYFKYETTKLINLQRDSPGVKFWQRNYYEHIVRNEDSLNILRNYIVENPLRWEIDVLHPDNLTGVW